MKWLITIGVDDTGGFFTPVVDDYANALGPTGVAAYRKIIDERWEAGERGSPLMDAKRGLARLDRDVDALVETTYPNFPGALQLTEVARELFKMGMPDEGLAFAERAIAAKCDRAGQPDRFEHLILDLRDRHARRPTFLRELHRAGFG